MSIAQPSSSSTGSRSDSMARGGSSHSTASPHPSRPTPPSAQLPADSGRLLRLEAPGGRGKSPAQGGPAAQGKPARGSNVEVVADPSGGSRGARGGSEGPRAPCGPEPPPSADYSVFPLQVSPARLAASAGLRAEPRHEADRRAAGVGPHWREAGNGSAVRVQPLRPCPTRRGTPALGQGW